MPHRPLIQIAALALSALAMSACAVAPKPAPASPQTLASYPHGAFLENLTVAPDQTVYATSYFAKQIVALSPANAAQDWAALPAHPVGIIQTPTGFLVTAHRIPFTKAPDFLSSNVILVLDRKGNVERTIAAPDARFLNGLVAVAPDMVLIADSVAGLIWALTPSSGALRPWLADPLLAADPAAKDFRPGANGLKLRDGALYVSNSSRGAIYRVALTPTFAPAGAPVTVAAPGPVDDFAFAPRGTIYATTHGEKLLAIAPDGTVRALLETGCDACTSVALARRNGKDTLIVLTTGKLLEGGDAPARILAVAP